MRTRKAELEVDIDAIVDLNCDPDLSAERQAEARELLLHTLGPYAQPALRACMHAAVARRDSAAARRRLEEMLTGAQLRGIVTGVDDGRVSLLLAGTERVLPRPEGMQLGIGQTVRTDAEGRTVLSADHFLVGGHTFAFCEPLRDRRALVRPLREGEHDDARQLALVADSVDMGTLAPGDRVLGWSSDYGNLVLVTHRLGPLRRDVPDDHGLQRIVTRDDIVGLEHVLDEVDLLFLHATTPTYAALLEQASPALVGVVFDGSTGVGKSLVADYAVFMVRQRGGRAFYRTASHYLSKWVGEGAAAMRADFALLDAAFTETGVRPLLVIDELEAIAVDRTHGSAIHGGYLDVLDTLLSLLTHTGARMIGISNMTTRFLETALTRGGRLRIVSFPATLGPQQVAALTAKRLARVPLANGEPGVRCGQEQEEEVAREFGETISDLVFAPDGVLAELLRVQLGDGRVFTFGAPDLVTGSVVADGIVRPALARALRRDMRAGRLEPSPLTLEELRQATLRYFAERSSAITRDNIRSVLRERIPEDQVVVRVEHVPIQGDPRVRG